MAQVLYDDKGEPVTVAEIGTAPDAPTAPRGYVLVALDSGGLARFVQTRNADPASVDHALVTRDIERTVPTFYAVFDRITMAADKYVATLFNTSSTRKVVMQRIWVYNWQFDGIQGGDNTYELVRITARTAGTAVTIRSEDTDDTLSTGITADTNSTAVTEDHLIQRVFSSGDESQFTSFALKSFITLPLYALRYERRVGQRGITLRENQGISLQFDQGDDDGTVSVVYEFTDEVA